ncbi:cobalamin B12-binding domain-containing protein [Jatrophihabitans telluris]|uniref:Cobalamin B12-binding domain-containing protein n=1 Tax=Jatrophihabitans telluris TaxID=2038343 RepID=A0ABY4R3B5_9ACTN|nr:cobalamin B12-binding domain-containing protein [Jatrophihabitans telluris]
MPTLRSWELRYGIPAMDRESGRHRRYNNAELHAMRLMRDEIARGKRASVAAHSVQQMLGQAGPARGYLDRFLAAAEQENPAAIRRQLDRAREGLGLGACIDDVLLPALHQVGTWWQTGRCDIDQERLTTETVRGWLDRQSSLAPPTVDPTPIVLACGPSDLHTVGLESFALLLRMRGRSCRVLGARTPALALITAIQASGARQVVIVSHLSSGRHRAVESLRQVAALGVQTYFAGNAFSSTAARRGVPGEYLGTRLQDACSALL